MTQDIADVVAYLHRYADGMSAAGTREPNRLASRYLHKRATFLRDLAITFSHGWHTAPRAEGVPTVAGPEKTS
jgi:hypothetical protein